MTIYGGVVPGSESVPGGPYYGAGYPTQGILGLRMGPSFGRVPGDGAVSAPASPLVAPSQSGIPGGVCGPGGGGG